MLASLKALAADICEGAQGDAALEPQGRPFNRFRCDACAAERSAVRCPRCHATLVDAVLLCLGASAGQGPSLGEFGRFIEEYVLGYSLAINSWLQHAAPRSVPSLAATCYLSPYSAADLAARVHAALGEKDPAKEWLAACLLKTVKDNQRWHDSTELIDDFPEATSWLRQ